MVFWEKIHGYEDPRDRDSQQCDRSLGMHGLDVQLQENQMEEMPKIELKKSNYPRVV